MNYVPLTFLRYKHFKNWCDTMPLTKEVTTLFMTTSSIQRLVPYIILAIIALGAFAFQRSYYKNALAENSPSPSPTVAAKPQTTYQSLVSTFTSFFALCE